MAVVSLHIYSWLLIIVFLDGNIPSYCITQRDGLCQIKELCLYVLYLVRWVVFRNWLQKVISNCIDRTHLKYFVNHTNYEPAYHIIQWRSWLRHCATNRKVAGSMSDVTIECFHWHNPSVRTVALSLTQPLTEMSTRNIYCGLRQPVPKADNLTIFMCWLSRNTVILNLLQP